MKFASKTLLIFTTVALSINLLARDSEDNQIILNKIVDFHPEISEIISPQGLESAGHAYVTSISSERPVGLSSIPNNPLDDKESKYLKTLQIYNTQKLLELDSLPLIFEMLTQAISENNPQKIGFWIVCLNNNISSYTDLESFPEVEYLNKYIPALFPDIKTPKGKTISLRGSCSPKLKDALKSDSGKSEYARLSSIRKTEVVSTIPETLHNFLLQRPASLLLASQIHANYFVQNIQRFAIDKDKTTHNGQLAVIKSAVDSITTTAAIITTAQAFAKSKTIYKSPSVNDIQALKQAKVQSSPLGSSLLLKEIVDQQDPQASIGLFCERTSASRRPLLGSQSHLFLSLVGRSLIENQRAYRILDLDESYAAEKLPAPSEMPLLIIPSSNYIFRSGWIISKKLEIKFQDYIKAGGKIIWFGSDHIRFLGDLSTSMTPITKEITLDPGNKAEITDLTNPGSAITIDVIRVPSNFNKIIKSGLTIRASDKFKPLLTFNDSTSVTTIAASTKDHTMTYINPLFFYPASIDETYGKLIPCAPHKEMSAFFNSSLNLLLEKK